MYKFYSNLASVQGFKQLHYNQRKNDSPTNFIADSASLVHYLLVVQISRFFIAHFFFKVRLIVLYSAKYKYAEIQQKLMQTTIEFKK